MILIAITSSCANEPFARGSPCGKRVRWSSWGRRLNDLAQRDVEAPADGVKTVFRGPGNIIKPTDCADFADTTQIADSSSTNAVSFSSARTKKRLPSP